MRQLLAAALSHWLAAPTSVSAIDPISGGCISHAARIRTSAGLFFAKWGSAGDPEEMFPRETDGLKALASALGAQAGVVVPSVVGAARPDQLSHLIDGQRHPGLLITQWLPPAAVTVQAALRLGRGLATIHRSSSENFGFPAATYCGPTLQVNTPTAIWSTFFHEYRLLPLIAALGAAGRLDSGDRRRLDGLCARLDNLIGTDEPPALVHGDLWSGNVCYTQSGPALVDPTVSYSHREIEFGLVTLFGGFHRLFFDGYQEAFPLDTDWRTRNPLYELYHLLNHALLFGGGYLARGMNIARAYL